VPVSFLADGALQPKIGLLTWRTGHVTGMNAKRTGSMFGGRLPGTPDPGVRNMAIGGRTMMADKGGPVAIFTDLAWLPEGSTAEVWLGDATLPPELCSAAFALAFFPGDGRLLLSDVRTRGPDIPGGRVEPGEDAEAAAVRETVEETGAKIRIIGKIGHLRLVVPKPPPAYRYPTPNSFQPFYAAAIESMGPVGMPEECSKPLVAEPLSVADMPRFRLHRALILAATDMFRDMRTSSPRQ